MGNSTKKLSFAIALVLIVAALSGSLWFHLSQRRALPFTLAGDPVIARRILPLISAVDGPEDAPQLHNFTIIGDPVSVAPNVATNLREILNTPSTYTFSDSTCFEPAMAVSFGDGASRVDVLICLYCDRAVFYSGNSQVGHQVSAEGHRRLGPLYQQIFGVPPPKL